MPNACAARRPARPEPSLVSLPPRGQAWDLVRYRAYQAQLAAEPTLDGPHMILR